MADDDLTFTTGDVSGTAVQAHTIHGNVYLQAPPSAGPPQCEPPSTWAEATGDLPTSIVGLLWAQQQTADLLPYRLPGARTPALGTIYVRQDLGGGVEDAAAAYARPASMLDERGRLVEIPTVKSVRVAVRPPSKLLRAALDADTHLLVLGGPGQGKSTLSLRLSADIAGHWTLRTDDNAPLAEPVIPLRITARTLAKHLRSSFARALAESAFAEHGRYLSGPLDPALFASRVAGCRWLLLVDALDEVTDSALRTTLVHTLSAWASRDVYRVLLTTRPTEGGVLVSLQRAGAARYELQPFGAEALRRFAHHWFEEFGNEHADRFLHQIREAHLDELVEVPLLATIAAIVFERFRDRPLPGNQYELYEAYLDFIRSPGRVVEALERRRVELVEHLGHIRLTSESSLLATARDWARRHDVPGIDEFVAYVVNVGPFVKRGDDIAFLHHSFAEHVAATGRARELPTEFSPQDQVFAELLHEAYPEESGSFARAVLLHYTHLRAAEADRLLRWLHAGGSEEHLLAARLLARHLPAGRRQVEEFLVTVRAWAMTTRYTARLILRDASRATRHEGLIEWLAELMYTSAAPQESRVEAAVALAVRLPCVHTDAAISMLKSAIDDRSASVDECLVAAEALAHSGSSYREAAERGLRSVLADPNASGADYRSAAVVLSAFNSEARDFALTALERLVSDVDTPDLDLVEATTGLLEIDAKFHDRSAEIFLRAIRNQAHTAAGRREATVGLASLGLREKAAEALTAVVTARRLAIGYRSSTAELLALLGPEYLATARALVLSEIDRPIAEHIDRILFAPGLARFGLRERSAAVLREALADPTTTWNHLVGAANYLADLGPAFHDEAAAHFEYILAHLPPKGFDYQYALNSLAALGEARRHRALERMWVILLDPFADPDTRCSVAADLIRLSPERHADIVQQLITITRTERDSSVLVRAWRELVSLGPELCGQAKRALVLLVKQSRDGSEAPFALGRTFSSFCAGDRSMAADLLAAVAQDDRRGARTRLSAVRGLHRLGRGFHRRAAELLSDLIESGAPINLTAAVEFADSGRGVREVVTHALHGWLRAERSGSARVWTAVQALDMLDDRAQDKALRAVVADQSAILWQRVECALILADSDPASLSTAIYLHARGAGEIAIPIWRRLAAKAARAGADVRASLLAVLSDPNRTCRSRAAAASLLGVEGIVELRGYADDPYLDLEVRSEAYRFLAGADPAALSAAIGFHQTVMDDLGESSQNRCDMAVALTKLDRSFAPVVVTALWRCAESPLLSASERAYAAIHLSSFDEPLSPRLLRLVIGLCDDRGLGDSLYARLVRTLPRPRRTELERVLLTDCAKELADRVPIKDYYGDMPLLDEAQVVIRRVLADAMSVSKERRQAAVELARLSEKHVPESVDILLADGSSVALAEAAKLGAWQQVLERVLDETGRWRVRMAAALRVSGMSGTPAVRDMLAGQSSRLSWRDRVDVLAYLGHHDYLRTLRDDRMGLPAQRWRAASKLVKLTSADRTAAARLYHHMATDPALRPPLRQLVARDLAKLGTQGRAEAIVIFRGMAEDGSLPVLTRSRAASWLSDEMPTSRADMMEIQRECLAVSTPLQRVHVLRSMSRGPSWEAIEELLQMAVDHHLSPRIRLWCVRSVVAQRIDFRDRCGVVAREIAFDLEAPKHVRLRAATCLARWSEVMRADARALVLELRGG